MSVFQGLSGGKTVQTARRPQRGVARAVRPTRRGWATIRTREDCAHGRRSRVQTEGRVTGYRRAGLKMEYEMNERGAPTHQADGSAPGRSPFAKRASHAAMAGSLAVSRWTAAS